jgi:tyrosyl-DNA phosphodiesterase 2
MATGGSNEDDYDLLMNRPKVLPCSHTYCFTCIQVSFLKTSRKIVWMICSVRLKLILHDFSYLNQAMISSGNPLKCPMCRKTAVGIVKVESLPNNVHAEHIVLLNEKLEKAEAEAKLLVLY